MDELLHLIRSIVDPEEVIDAETPLLSTGLIDSFDVMQLLAAFEDRFGVVIDPADIDAESFDTPRQMLAHLEAARQ